MSHIALLRALWPDAREGDPSPTSRFIGTGDYDWQGLNQAVRTMATLT